MKPSSKNEAINMVVNGYALQKTDEALGLDKDYANSWKVFNDGYEYDQILNIDLVTSKWDEECERLYKNEKVLWGAFYVTFPDGHKQVCLALVDLDLDGEPLRLECVEILDNGSSVYHQIDDDGDKVIPNDESVSNILTTLLTLENSGIGGGSGDTVTKEEFEALVKVTPTEIISTDNGIVLGHDGEILSGQTPVEAGAQIIVRRY